MSSSFANRRYVSSFTVRKHWLRRRRATLGARAPRSLVVRTKQALDQLHDARLSVRVAQTELLGALDAARAELVTYTELCAGIVPATGEPTMTAHRRMECADRLRKLSYDLRRPIRER